MNLTLAAGILEELLADAKSSYPNEGCGLLAGRATAERFIKMANIASRATEFEMDPVELINTLRDLRGRGEELVAIYHSHPHAPAEPSKKDIERAYYPEAAHVIVSLAELQRPRVAAFRIVDGEAIPIELHAIV
jgi:[CysO sulfur-carrier protein]-S-L-cysteine hydrolase